MGFAYAPQILNLVELGREADAGAGDDGNAEAHFVHAVVHHHFQVVHLDNLVPHVGQEREREIAVSDGVFVLAFLLGTLHIDVNPLMVERGIGKMINSLLVYFKPFRYTKRLAFVGGKFLKRVDDKFLHIGLGFCVRATNISILGQLCKVRL